MILDSKTYQWGGVAFMLGSLFFLVNKLNEMSRLFFSHWMPDVIDGQDTLPIVIGQVAFIIGYIGFWRLYAARVSRGGKFALGLFCGGGIMLAFGHMSFMSALGNVEYLFALVLLGMLLLTIGLIWFGILNLRQPVLSHWPWLPLVTGVMGFIGFFLFSGEEITAVFLFFRTLFALGLFGLGLTMWLDNATQVKVAR